VCDRNENLIDALADHKMTVYLDTFGGESIESSSR
jgi:hypothetical protein